MLNLENYALAKNVHVFRQGDLNIAYDVNSGSLHLLDEASYHVLKAIERLQEDRAEIGTESVYQYLKRKRPELDITLESVAEIWEELGALQAEGTLCSNEAPEIPPLYPEEPLIKAICLHVAHDCNLRCAYCFAGTGSFGGKRELMSLETGKKAIDFVLEASRHRNHCEVDFFGGEPLLNFAVLKQLVAYGRERAQARHKTIKFTLTTNGVLLSEEVQQFLEEEDISVVLSLDGRKEVHDRMRPLKGGQGSYDLAVKRITEFIRRRPASSAHATGTYYYVRGTFTHFNPDFDRDVLHMLDLGMNYISLEPVVAGPEDAYALLMTTLQKSWLLTIGWGKN